MEDNKILREFDCDTPRSYKLFDLFKGGCAVPIYEYQCAKCGEVFEAFQKVSDKPLTRCKFCQGKVERLISQSSFQLKGSGWYLTDYPRKSQSSASTSEGGEKKPAEKSGDSASDAKPKSEKKTPDKE